LKAMNFVAFAPVFALATAAAAAAHARE